jgi:hypothetical protein
MVAAFNECESEGHRDSLCAKQRCVAVGSPPVEFGVVRAGVPGAHPNRTSDRFLVPLSTGRVRLRRMRGPSSGRPVAAHVLAKLLPQPSNQRRVVMFVGHRYRT